MRAQGRGEESSRMHRSKRFYAGLGILAFLAAACLSLEGGGAARPRDRPGDWGFGGAPTTCGAGGADVCTPGDEDAGCPEIETCDPARRAAYPASHPRFDPSP